MPADPLLPQIIVLVILIILNALFTAAEMAVTSLPEGKLRKQAEEGDEKADRLLRLNSAVLLRKATPDGIPNAINIMQTRPSSRF